METKKPPLLSSKSIKVLKSRSAKETKPSLTLRSKLSDIINVRSDAQRKFSLKIDELRSSAAEIVSASKSKAESLAKSGSIGDAKSNGILKQFARELKQR